MTKEEYIKTVGTFKAAVEFEEWAIGVEDEFLPTFVADVINDNVATIPAEYWQWLIEQFKQVIEEAS